MKARTAALWFAPTLTAAALCSAQSREPLCVPVRADRLAWTARTDFDLGAWLAAEPVSSTRIALITRESHGGFSHGIGDRTRLSDAAPSVPSTSALRVVRVDEDLQSGRESLVVPDPPGVTLPVRSFPLTAVPLPSGALVLEALGPTIHSVVIPPSGPIAAPRAIAEAPEPSHPWTWVTAVERGDGAIALAGDEEGRVTALRFDATGALVGHALPWTRRVGGPMHLLPTNDGPPAALLGRPVLGSGPDAESPRVQVLVTLDETTLEPVGEPFGTGFAQYPIAAVQRGHYLVILQWAREHGVAIATLPVGEHRIGEQLPRIWEARPPLEGRNQGHGAILGSANVLYDVVAYTEGDAAVHTHLAWLPPSDAPIVRRDVLSLHGVLLAQPVLLPARDGVVVFVAMTDETGTAIDAFHIRCDLVDVPEQ